MAEGNFWGRIDIVSHLFVYVAIFVYFIVNIAVYVPL